MAAVDTIAENFVTLSSPKQPIEVEQNTNPSVATAVARSTENGLVVDFQKGAGTGTTTIVVAFTITTLRPAENIASDDQTYADFIG